MGSKYTSQSATGYNASPPSDDGSAVASNQVLWATIKTKLTDPIKTLADAINSAMLSASDLGPESKSSAYTTVASDHRKTIEVSGVTSITLGAPSTMGAGYRVTIYNSGTDIVTVACSSLIDGDTSRTIAPYGSVTFQVESGGGTYITISDSEIPGVVKDYAGSTAPGGYLFCYGQAISRADYARLYAVLGTSFGVGDGTSTFNLPDCRGRVVAGKDDMGGTAASRITSAGKAGVDGTTLGASGGEQDHTLVTAESPSHDHGGASGGAGSHSHTLNTAGSGVGTLQWLGSITTGNTISAANFSDNSVGNHTHSISSVGGDGAHNNLPPLIVLNKIIKA